MWCGTLCRLWKRFDTFVDKADVDIMVMFDHIFNFIDLLYILPNIYLCQKVTILFMSQGGKDIKEKKASTIDSKQSINMFLLLVGEKSFMFLSILLAQLHELLRSHAI